MQPILVPLGCSLVTGLVCCLVTYRLGRAGLLEQVMRLTADLAACRAECERLRRLAADGTALRQAATPLLQLLADIDGFVASGGTPALRLIKLGPDLRRAVAALRPQLDAGVAAELDRRIEALLADDCGHDRDQARKRSQSVTALVHSLFS